MISGRREPQSDAEHQPIDLEFAPSTGQVASVLLDLSLRLAKESPQQVRKELMPKAVSSVKHLP